MPNEVNFDRFSYAAVKIGALAREVRAGMGTRVVGRCMPSSPNPNPEPNFINLHHVPDQRKIYTGFVKTLRYPVPVKIFAQGRAGGCDP